MSRKIYAALLPVLAVAAFAAIPATSQAAVHWFKCEHSAAKTHKWTDSSCSVANAKTEGEYERVELPLEKEGKVTKIRVKTFGVLTLSVGTVHVTCFVDDHGKVWNKTAATNGLDEVQFFENYECESTSCPSGVTITAEGLPWATELGAGPIDTIKGIQIKLVCTGVLTETFTGELSPKFVNGTQANGGGSFAQFEAGSGTLTGSGGNKATAEGRDYVFGVVNGEVILAF